METNEHDVHCPECGQYLYTEHDYDHDEDLILFPEPPEYEEQFKMEDDYYAQEEYYADCMRDLYAMSTEYTDMALKELSDMDQDLPEIGLFH